MEAYARKWKSASGGQKGPTEVVTVNVPAGGSLGLTIWRCATSIVVTKVAPGSIASDAGFKPLDVIVAIGSVQVGVGPEGAPEAAAALLTKIVPGNDLQITKSFYAGGPNNEDDTLREVVMAYHADPEKHVVMDTVFTMGGSTSTGITFNMVCGEKSTGDTPDMIYAIVKEVAAGSPASIAGIKVHDLIVEIEGTKVVGSVSTAAEVKSAFATAGDNIKVTYGRLNDWSMTAFAVRQHGVNRDAVADPAANFKPMLAKAVLFINLIRMMLFPLICGAGTLVLAANAVNPVDVLFITAGLIFLVDCDQLFFNHFVAESEKTAMSAALADISSFDETLPAVKSQIATTAQMMKLMGSMSSGSKADADDYKEMVDASKKLLVSQVKEYTDFRQGMATSDAVAGRKKRLQKLIFPHYMTFGVFESINSKVVLAMDSEGSSGTAKNNIFIYAAWKVTSGDINYITVFKIFLCALFQIGAVCELLWAQGMKAYFPYDSPFKGDDTVDPSYVCGAASFATILAVIMIYMHALEDVYALLQSVALMSWADHYDDFTHRSAWYDCLFPGTGEKFNYHKAVFSCCTGGLFAGITTATTTLALFMSSALVMPLVLAAMIVYSISPNAHCAM